MSGVYTAVTALRGNRAFLRNVPGVRSNSVVGGQILTGGSKHVLITFLVELGARVLAVEVRRDTSNAIHKGWRRCVNVFLPTYQFGGEVALESLARTAVYTPPVCTTPTTFITLINTPGDLDSLDMDMSCTNMQYLEPCPTHIKNGMNTNSGREKILAIVPLYPATHHRSVLSAIYDIICTVPTAKKTTLTIVCFWWDDA